jgi:hypothetical protein
VSRTVERCIDLLATAVLLAFAYLLREGQPGLAGAVVMASVSFWLNKNASAPDSPAHKEAEVVAQAAAAAATAAATAAAEVLRTARTAETRPAGGPDEFHRETPLKGLPVDHGE